MLEDSGIDGSGVTFMNRQPRRAMVRGDERSKGCRYALNWMYETSAVDLAAWMLLRAGLSRQVETVSLVTSAALELLDRQPGVNNFVGDVAKGILMLLREKKAKDNVRRFLNAAISGPVDDVVVIGALMGPDPMICNADYWAANSGRLRGLAVASSVPATQAAEIIGAAAAWVEGDASDETLQALKTVTALRNGGRSRSGGLTALIGIAALTHLAIPATTVIRRTGAVYATPRSRAAR